MGQTEKTGVSGDDENRHQIRHQTAREVGGKAGPGRPRRAPENCRLVGWTERHGYRYQACPRVDGVRVYGKNATREEAIAEAARIQQRAKASAGKSLISLHAACQQIIDLAPSAGTKRDYDECCTTLCGFFGTESALHEVTTARVRDYIAHRRATRWRGQPIGEVRIAKELRVLGRVFNVAIKNDQFPDASPLLKIEKPSARPVEAQHYTVDELAEILATMRAQTWPTTERAWRLVAVLAFSGLRRDELCRLTAGQVDLQAGTLRQIEGKRNVANLPITKPLAAVLRPLVENLKATDHIVPAGEARGPRKDGNRPRSDLERREGIINGIFRRFREALPERLRERFHPHTMRHSLRTILADAGMASHMRNALTRHAGRGDGARYEHVSPLRLRNEACGVLDPLLWLVDPAATSTTVEQRAQ
jgi:integrase